MSFTALGGYGAIIHGMKYAKYWGAVADHSGDAYFDFVYRHNWPNTLDELAKHRVSKRKPGAYDARREEGRSLPAPRSFTSAEMQTWIKEDERDLAKYRGGT